MNDEATREELAARLAAQVDALSAEVEGDVRETPRQFGRRQRCTACWGRGAVAVHRPVAVQEGNRVVQRLTARAELCGCAHGHGDPSQRATVQPARCQTPAELREQTRMRRRKVRRATRLKQRGGAARAARKGAAA